MNQKLLAAIIISVLAIIIGSGALFFVSTHERVEFEVPMHMQGPALSDPHLALRQYFEAMQVSTREIRYFKGGSFEEASIFVASYDGLVPYDWVSEELNRWMEAGGHLVLVAPFTMTVMDGIYLLDELETLGGGDDFWPELWTYDIERFAFNRRWWGLPAGTDYAAVSIHDEEETPRVISAPRGEGRLTMILDERFLESWRLQYDDDLGQLWADILSLGNQWPEDALFYTQPAQPFFSRVFFQRGWPALLGVLILLAAAVSRGRRFGPALALRPYREVRRLAHVEATGRFFWHYQEVNQLIHSVQRALLETLGRRRPSTRRMSTTEKAKRLAEELGEDEALVSQLLREENGLMSREAFTERIARLEELRRRL